MDEKEDSSNVSEKRLSNRSERGAPKFEEGVHENADSLHRRLGNRQIQLIAIGMR